VARQSLKLIQKLVENVFPSCLKKKDKIEMEQENEKKNWQIIKF
jgi:hypothetical protein